MSEYCMKCMRALREDGTCPECGALPDVRNAAHQLPCGTVLAGRYLVGGAIGQGGFGITYIGRDLVLNMRVAIKEYFPAQCAGRSAQPDSYAVETDAANAAYFKENKSRFLKEARVLARFRGSSGIVGVWDYFEANKTAYIIMEYLDGEDLRSRLKRELLSAGQAFGMMRPVMDALEKVHGAHVVHRDISPDNIMVLRDGSLRLMDFGAAKILDYSDQHTVSIVLKSGYAPEEQYRPRGQIGPWTDIYALCATVYKCITGVTPDDSLQRMHDDETVWPSEMGIRIPEGLEAVLKRGMGVYAAERFQSIAELREALEALPEEAAEVVAPVAREPLGSDDEPDAATGDWPLEEQAPSRRGGRTPVVVAAVALGVLLAAFAAVSALAAAGVFHAPQSFTVAFDSAGGSPVGAVRVEEGGYVEEPPPPSRSGYTFAGWFRDDSYDERAVFPLTVEGEMTLRAAWDEQLVAYTVRYLEKGTDKVLKKAKRGEARVGSTVSEKAPTIDGYVLVSKKKKGIELSGDESRDAVVFYYREASRGSSSSGLGRSSSDVSSGPSAGNVPYVEAWDDSL